MLLFCMLIFKVSSGSIIVEFELFKHEEGRDIRNVSSQLRDMVS
jgi:hypothetical protein